MDAFTIFCPYEDGHSDQIEMVKLAFDDLNYQTDFISDVELLCESQRKDIDLILLEPSIRSWEWLEILLKAREIIPEIPVVLYSLNVDGITDLAPVGDTCPVYITDNIKCLTDRLLDIIQLRRQQNKRILFVDDDQLVLRAYGRILHDQPWQIVTADNAEDALVILGDNHIDLVVTDIKMPGTHGIALIAKLRELDAAIPVIACSAYPGMKDDDELRYHGVAAFVEKPVDQGVLVETIRGIIHQGED